MTRTIKAIKTKEIAIEENGTPVASDYLLVVENYNDNTIATARNKVIKKGKTILAGGEKVVIHTSMTDEEWLTNCTIDSVEPVTEDTETNVTEDTTNA